MEEFQKQMISTFIESLENNNMKEFAVLILNDLPEYWWNVPASSSRKYHPQYVSGDYGLFYHSYAVCQFSIWAMGLEQYQNKFTSIERDAIKIVSLTHDGLKHGIEEKGHTVWEHPLLISERYKSYKGKVDVDDDIIDFMSNIVSSHMGQWNENKKNSILLPKPLSEAQQLVHIFDYFASRKTCEINFEDVAPIKKETIETFKFTFGKHNGDMLTDVIEKDPSYIDWLKENYHKEPLRTLLNKI